MRKVPSNANHAIGEYIATMLEEGYTVRVRKALGGVEFTTSYPGDVQSVNRTITADELEAPSIAIGRMRAEQDIVIMRQRMKGGDSNWSYVDHAQEAKARAGERGYMSDQFKIIEDDLQLRGIRFADHPRIHFFIVVRVSEDAVTQARR